MHHGVITMNSSGPKEASRNPKIHNRIVRSLDIVDRAIAQADMLFPMSSLNGYADPTYSEFMDDSWCKIESVIKECDPATSVGIIDRIIVETGEAVGALVAVRGMKSSSPRRQFLKAEVLIKELIDSYRRSAETITKISKDEFLSRTVAYALRGLRTEEELFVRSTISKFLRDSAGNSEKSSQKVFDDVSEEIAKEVSPDIEHVIYAI